MNEPALVAGSFSYGAQLRSMVDGSAHAPKNVAVFDRTDVKCLARHVSGTGGVSHHEVIDPGIEHFLDNRRRNELPLDLAIFSVDDDH